KTKRKSDDSILKRKARLVARGYTQIPGIDVHNTFAPVSRLGLPRVYCLNKALYGLQQAPRAWHQTLHHTLTSLHLTPSAVDPHVYTRGEAEIILFVYVNDMGITGSNADLINTTKRRLQQQFEMEELGRAEWILGIRIRFGMATCNSSTTPADPHELSTHPESLLSPHDIKHYQTLVGSLLYLSICTRPDISHAVMQLT
ncbi:unnamed protein product, partial [Choristocarpus tenellus]